MAEAVSREQRPHIRAALDTLLDLGVLELSDELAVQPRAVRVTIDADSHEQALAALGMAKTQLERGSPTTMSSGGGVGFDVTVDVAAAPPQIAGPAGEPPAAPDRLDEAMRLADACCHTYGLPYHGVELRAQHEQARRALRGFLSAALVDARSKGGPDS